ncbi:MAG: hypothetical protein ACFFA0_07835 [Promethearchaeota archaeon]
MSDEKDKKDLEKKIRNLEIEKQLLDAERLRLEQELHSLRNEIDRLREPPLVGAVVVDVLDEESNKILVSASTGAFFVVNMSRRLTDKKIEAGTIVALNQRTFAVMDVIPITSEQIKKAREQLLVTEITLKKDYD